MFQYSRKKEGNPIACDNFNTQAREFAHDVSASIRQLNVQNLSFDLALMGRCGVSKIML
jgi:hypothetical protein